MLKTVVTVGAVYFGGLAYFSYKMLYDSTNDQHINSLYQQRRNQFISESGIEPIYIDKACNTALLCMAFFWPKFSVGDGTIFMTAEEIKVLMFDQQGELLISMARRCQELDWY